jgi:hypothetical protein
MVVFQHKEKLNALQIFWIENAFLNKEKSFWDKITDYMS